MLPDSQAGYSSRELGTDPFIGEPGSNQIVEGNSHDGKANVTSQSNRVQAGQLPRNASLGSPTKANPLGKIQ